MKKKIVIISSIVAGVIVLCICIGFIVSNNNKPHVTVSSVETAVTIPSVDVTETSLKNTPTPATGGTTTAKNVTNTPSPAASDPVSGTTYGNEGNQNSDPEQNAGGSNENASQTSENSNEPTKATQSSNGTAEPTSASTESETQETETTVSETTVEETVTETTVEETEPEPTEPEPQTEYKTVTVTWRATDFDNNEYHGTISEVGVHRDPGCSWDYDNVSDVKARIEADIDATIPGGWDECASYGYIF